MRFMQIESVLQIKNRSEPAKNRFSVALVCSTVKIRNILTSEKFGVIIAKFDHAYKRCRRNGKQHRPV